jgi:hypothetical protein
MKFEILSEKRNKYRFRIFFFILFLSALSGVIVIETNNLVAKIFFGITCVFFLTPIYLFGSKIIGEFELNDNDISFLTQQGEFIKLYLSEIIHCKLVYSGSEGSTHVMAGGLTWNSGVSLFTIRTKEQQYEILFLSKSLYDQDKFIRYIDILKNNSISYYFDMDGCTFDSSVE